MSFDQFETSQAGGRPTELYEVAIGAQLFTFTSGPESLTVQGVDYQPVEIQRDRIVAGSDDARQQLTLTVPSANPIAQLYRQIPPGSTGVVTIKRVHRPDFPDPDTLVVFKGVVKSAAFSDDGQVAQIAVTPISTRLNREVPRYTYQGLCNHVLYDGRCKVSQAAFQHTGQVLSVDGNEMNIQGLSSDPDDWYTGGFVQFAAADWRLVLAHAGNAVTLLLPFTTNLTGQNVDVFAGCAHNIETCNEKFQNGRNYGGHAFVPLRNPFEKGVV